MFVDSQFKYFLDKPSTTNLDSQFIYSLDKPSTANLREKENRKTVGVILKHILCQEENENWNIKKHIYMQKAIKINQDYISNLIV